MRTRNRLRNGFGGESGNVVTWFLIKDMQIQLHIHTHMDAREYAAYSIERASERAIERACERVRSKYPQYGLLDYACLCVGTVLLFCVHTACMTRQTTATHKSRESKGKIYKYMYGRMRMKSPYHKPHTRARTHTHTRAPRRFISDKHQMPYSNRIRLTETIR